MYIVFRLQHPVCKKKLIYEQKGKKTGRFG